MSIIKKRFKLIFLILFCLIMLSAVGVYAIFASGSPVMYMQTDAPDNINLGEWFTVKVAFYDQGGTPVTGLQYNTDTPSTMPATEVWTKGKWFIESITNVNKQEASVSVDTTSAEELGNGIYQVKVKINDWPAGSTSDHYYILASYTGDATRDTNNTSGPFYSIKDAVGFKKDGPGPGLVKYFEIQPDKIEVPQSTNAQITYQIKLVDQLGNAITNAMQSQIYIPQINSNTIGQSIPASPPISNFQNMGAGLYSFTLTMDTSTKQVGVNFRVRIGYEQTDGDTGPIFTTSVFKINGSGFYVDAPANPCYANPHLFSTGGGGSPVMYMHADIPDNISLGQQFMVKVAFLDQSGSPVTGLQYNPAAPTSLPGPPTYTKGTWHVLRIVNTDNFAANATIGATEELGNGVYQVPVTITGWPAEGSDHYSIWLEYEGSLGPPDNNSAPSGNYWLTETVGFTAENGGTPGRLKYIEVQPDNVAVTAGANTVIHFQTKLTDQAGNPLTGMPAENFNYGGVFTNNGSFVNVTGFSAIEIGGGVYDVALTFDTSSLPLGTVFKVPILYLVSAGWPPDFVATASISISGASAAAPANPYYINPNLSSGPVTINPSSTDGTEPVTITFTADNTQNGAVNIASASYRINGPWLPMSPQDGAFNSPLEVATVTLAPFEVFSLGVGTHTVNLQAVDAGGGTINASGQLTVNSAFTSHITSPVPNSYISGSGNITGTIINFAGSTIDHVEISFNEGANWIPAVNTGTNYDTWSVPYDSLTLSDGQYHIISRATDNFGNPETPGPGTWCYVDNNPPTVVGEVPDYISGSATLMAGVSDSSGVTRENIWFKLDNNPLVNPDSYNMGTAFYVPPGGLTDGIHTLTITATDNSGRTSNASDTFTVDANGPEISGLGPMGYVNSQTPTLLANVADPVSGFNPNAIKFHFDGDPNGVTPGYSGDAHSGLATYTHPGLSQGPHTLVVKVTDNAGNTTTSSTLNFTVDVTTPSISGVSPSNGTTVPRHPVIEATFSDALSGINSNTVKFYIDGDAQALSPLANYYNTSTGKFTFPTGLTSGSHTLKLEAKDYAENPVSYTWTINVIDTDPPSITIVSPANGAKINTSTQTVQATLTDDISINSSSIVFKIDGVAQALTPIENYFNAGTFTYNTSMDDGTHNLYLEVQDGHGFKTTTPTWSVTVDTAKPNVSGLVVQNANTNTPTLKANVSDGSGTGVALPNIKFIIDGQTYDAQTYVGGVASYTPLFLAEGTYTFAVQATDNAGNISDITGSTTLEFKVDTHAPTVTNITPQLSNNPRPEFSATVDDNLSGVTQGTILFKIDSGSYVAASSYTVIDSVPTAKYTPASNISSGSHTLYIKATDAVGNVTTSSFAFTIDTAGPTLSGYSPLNNSYSSPKALLSATISDSSGIKADTVSMKISGYNGDAFFTPTFDSGTGLVSYALPTKLSTGVHTITVKATDNANNQSTNSWQFNASPATTWWRSESYGTDWNSAYNQAGDYSYNNATNWGWSDIRLGTTGYAPYPASGSYRSKTFDISTVGYAKNNSITWNANVPANTTLTVQTGLSFDGGRTWAGWQDATSGQAIPGITSTTNLNHARLRYQVNMTTTNSSATPLFYDISISLTADNTAPVISNLTPVSTTDSTPILTFTVRDVNESGVPSKDNITSLKLDNVVINANDFTFDTVTGTVTYNIPESSPLTDGTHTITVTAMDAAENTTTTNLTFSVDHTPPTVTYAPIYSASLRPTISANVSDNIGVNSILFFIDSDPIGVTPSYAAGVASYIPTTDLAEGAHTLTVQATDGAGNLTASGPHTFYVDTTAPTVTSLQPNATKLSQITLTNNATDGSGSGLAQMCYQDDSYIDVFNDGTINTSMWRTTNSSGATITEAGGNVTCTITNTATSTAAFENLNSLWSGHVEFDFDASSWGIPSSDSWKVYLSIKPYSTSNYFNFGYKKDSTGATKYTAWSNVAGFNPPDVPAAQTSGKLKAIRSGSTLDFYYFDNSSHKWTKFYSFTSSTVSQATPTAAIYVTNGTSGNSGFSTIIDNYIVWTNWEAYSTNKPYMNVYQSNGQQKSVFAQFKDNAGNMSATFNHTILKDTVAPTVTIDSSTPQYTSSFTPTLKANVADNIGGSGVNSKDNIVVKLDNVAVNASDFTFEGGVVTYTPALVEQKTYTFSVTATDAAGNSSSASHTLYFDQTGPSVTGLAPEFTGLQKPTLTANVSDALSGITDASSIKFYIDTDPIANPESGAPASSFSGGIASYTPAADLAEGPHTLKVVATDRAGNNSVIDASSTLNFKVDLTAPTVTSMSPQTANRSTVSLINDASDGSGSGLDQMSYGDEAWSDDFAGTQLNTAKWSSYAGDQASLTQSGGTTNIYLPTYRGWGKLKSKKTFNGDFDVQFDFDASNWPLVNPGPAPGYYEDGWHIMLSIEMPEYDGYGHTRLDYIRYKKKPDGSTIYEGNAAGETKIKPTSDKKGKFKAVRKGSTLDLYYFDSATGKWIKLQSTTDNDVKGNATISAYVYKYTDTDPTFTTKIDNFFSWYPWEDYSIGKNWTLSSGDGQKTVMAQFMDKVGNVSNAFYHYITKNTVAPTVNNLSPTTTTDDTPAFTAYVYDDNLPGTGDIQFIIDEDNPVKKMVKLADSYSSYIARYTPTVSLDEGPHTLKVKATDSCGNTTSSNITFYIDKTAPTVTSLTPQFAKTNPVTLTNNASDNANGSGLSLMRYANAALVDEFSDGVKGSIWNNFGNSTYTSENNGSMKINFTNGGGSSGYESAQTISGDFDLQIDFSNYSYSGSDYGIAYLQFYVDNSNWARTIRFTKNSTGENKFQGATNISGVTDYPEVPTTATSGKLRLQRWGNQLYSYYSTGSGWQLIKSWSGFSTAPGKIRLYASASSGVSLTTDFDNLVNWGSFELWSGWETYNANKNWNLTSGDGTKYVYAQFKDKTGNISNTILHTLNLDTVAPTVTNLGPAYSTSATPKLTATISDAAPSSGIPQNNIKFIIDKGTANEVVKTPDSYSGGIAEYTASLAEGSHTLRVEATDNSGNTKVYPSNSDAPFTFYVDQHGPNVTIITPVNTASTNTTFLANLSDAVSGVDSSTINLKIGGVDQTNEAEYFNPSTGVFSYDATLPVNPNLPLTLQVKDKAGNNSFISWNISVIEGDAPAITNISPAHGAQINTANPSIQATLSDIDGSINSSAIIFEIDNVPQLLNPDINYTPIDGNSGIFAYNAIALTDGYHTFTLTVQDNEGITTRSSWIVAVDTTGPEVSGRNPANGATSNLKPSISATVSDNITGVDSNSIVLKIDGQPVTHNYSNGTVSYTPTTNLLNGWHKITLVAKDMVGNETTTEWKINAQGSNWTRTDTSVADFNAGISFTTDTVATNAGNGAIELIKATYDSFENAWSYFTFSYPGAKPWWQDWGTKYNGGASYASGSISHSQSSVVSTTVNLSTNGTVSFYYRTSSEPNDALTFYIDNNPILVKSGNDGQWYYNLSNLSAGSHTLKWQYSKNGSVSEGLDRAWIDVLKVTGMGTKYPYTGTYESQAFDVSPVGVANDGHISWNANLPAGTAMTIKTKLSLDGVNWPAEWQTVSNGGLIPGIANANLNNARLKYQITMTSNVSAEGNTLTPQLNDITLNITPKDDLWWFTVSNLGPKYSKTTSELQATVSKLIVPAFTKEDIKFYIDEGAANEVVGTADSYSGGVARFTPPALSEGLHTLAVKDIFGNQPSPTLTFHIDSTKPEITEQAPIYTPNPRPTLTAKVTDANSGIKEVIDEFDFTTHKDILFVIDEGKPNAMAVTPSFTGDVYSGVASYTPTADLAMGEHTLKVVATDNADNTISSTVTFTINNGAPIITLINDSPATTIKATLTDQGVSGIDSSTIILKIDGKIQNLSPIAKFYDAATGLFTYQSTMGNGSHNLYLEVKNNAGVEASASWTVTIGDNSVVSGQAPTGTIQTGHPTIRAKISNPASIASVTVTVSRTVNNNPVNVIGPVAVTVDSSGNISLPVDLTDGLHTATLHIVDNLNNATEVSWTFTVATGEGPHGGYATKTDACFACHSTHNSTGQKLMANASSINNACIYCHDGVVSALNVKAELRGATSDHGLNSSNKCSNCHNPHLKNSEATNLLSAGPNHVSSGNDFCAVCHGSNSNNPGGNITTSFTGTPHDTKMANGENIVCLRCHSQHGSPLNNLLKPTIVDNNNIISNATDDNYNTVCYACHAKNLKQYTGNTTYDQSRHGTVTNSTKALVSWPGSGNDSNLCVNCHNPHGTGNSKYLVSPGNGLCFTCHVNSGTQNGQNITFPASYSYQGATAYTNSAHNNAAAASIIVQYKPNGNGFQAWQSSSLPLPPASGSPGTPLSYDQIEKISSNDTARWITGLATSDGSFNYQMYKFHLDYAAGDISKITPTWIGYGDPATGYETELYIRNNNTSSWESLNIKTAMGNEGTLSKVISSNITHYINNTSDVYVLVKAKHDGVAPVISNVSHTGVANGSASVQWDTFNEPSTSTVIYGFVTQGNPNPGIYPYSQTLPTNPDGTEQFGTHHSVILSNLLPGQTYYYKVRSVDASGNVIESSPYSFNTTESGQISIAPEAGTVLLAALPDRSFQPEQHYSLNTNYVYLEVSTVSSTQTTGGCTNCHNPHGNSNYPSMMAQSEDTICFNCHSNADKSASHIDIQSRFTANSSPLSHHSVSSSEQASGGTKVLCSNCHNPHMDKATSKVADPDNLGTPMVFNDISKYIGPGNDVYLMVDSEHWYQDENHQGPPLVTSSVKVIATSFHDSKSYSPVTGWQTSGIAPTPGSPPANPVNNPSGLSTNLAAADKVPNIQMYKFTINTPGIVSMAADWRGTGEWVGVRYTTLYIWNFTTGSWETAETFDLWSEGQDITLKWYKPASNSVTEYCYKCHDNTPPAGVVMGSATDIKTAYVADIHGSGVGEAPGLLSPYSKADPALGCQECHDPHGSSITYHLKENINGGAANYADNSDMAAACARCHTGAGPSEWHKECMDCHNDPGFHQSELQNLDASFGRTCVSCHAHGSSYITHEDCHCVPAINYKTF